MNKPSFNILMSALVILVSTVLARADFTYSNAVMALNPVAYWPLQETSQPTDIATNLGSAGSAYDGNYINGATQGTGALVGVPGDTAAKFDAIAGQMVVSNGPALALVPPFSIEAWINPAVAPQAVDPAGLLSCMDFSAGRSGALLYQNGAKFEMRFGDINGYNVIQDGTTTLTPGQWYHVVLTIDAASNATMYVNGNVDATATVTAYAPNTTGKLEVGGFSEFGRYAACSVGEVAVYTNALSAADVLAHYQNGTSSSPSQSYSSLVLASNPILYYRLNEPFTTVTAKNYGSFGTTVNGTYLPGSQPGTAGPVGAGLPATSYACTFNSVGGYVDCTTNSVLNLTNALTVVAWVKGGPADNRFQSFLGRSDGSWRADMDPTYAHWADGTGGDAVGGTGVNDGNWHFFAGVADGTNNYVYIDGALDGENTMSFDMGDPSARMLIGGVGDYIPGRLFQGSVAQVAVFTNALSASQIAALYANATNLQPVFVENPQDAAISYGGSASFSGVASQPSTYQWYFDNTQLSDVAGNIYGSTTTTLSISNATTANQGNYYVVATSTSGGSVTSLVAALTVYTNVVITSDISPASATLFAGGHATFSVVAGGAQPISYRWYTNSILAGGANNSSYTLPDVQANTTVQCVASNSFGPVSSSVANVTVIADPTASYPATILFSNTPPIGFWRLNETGPDGVNGPNNGVAAYDYWGGNNGTYTNTTLGNSGYNPTGEPAETSAGWLVFSNGMVFNIPTNGVDFSAPSNSSSAFSIECWVNGYAQTVDAGIVSKGTGGGGEQFNLDTGSHVANSSGTTDYDFRFFVRDASGATHGVSSTNGLDGSWHHLVAVCDEPDGYVALYFDGQLVGTNTITPGSGILASSQSMKIGSRPAGSDPNYNANQFDGYIDDVAVYNYALSPAQVLEQYNSADIPAKVAVQPPATVVADQNGTATITAVVEGTPPLTNQWWDVNTGQPVAGATNTTLVLNNVQASASYYLATANAFGHDQSQSANLIVVSGAPQIQPYGSDVQSPFFALQGGTGSDSIVVYGTAPISYQWQFYSNGTWGNLADGNGISGSQSNVLTIANAQVSEEGQYRAIAQNTSGSVTSSVAMFIVGNPIGFYPALWQANGVATFGNNALTLTTQSGGGQSSYFFDTPQYVGAFKAHFTYINESGDGVVNDTADGFTFILQNSPAGTSALGGGGSGLGYANPPITPSAELCFELYDNGDNAPGMAWATDGAPSAGVQTGGFKYSPVDPVSIITNDPVDVSLLYDGNVLFVTLSNEIERATFSTNIVVGSLPQIVNGDTAYVGFTAACGGITATQVITNFSFVSIPMESISATATNAAITWPQGAGGYLLQENSDLSTANWVNVTNSVETVNGQFQVTVPLGTSNQFFRLQLP